LNEIYSWCYVDGAFEMDLFEEEVNKCIFFEKEKKINSLFDGFVIFNF
jgi:hypothetical protein